MSLDQFVNKYNGKKKDFDGAYGAQCVDLIKLYTAEVYGTPNWTTGNGCATGIFTSFPAALRPHFDKVANNPQDPNQMPPRGAIIVIAGTKGNPCGHTGVVLSANRSTFSMIEQNAPPGTPIEIENRNYVNVIGWLAPKGVQSGGDDMYDGKTAEQWYQVANDHHVKEVENLKLAKKLQSELDQAQKDGNMWHVRADDRQTVIKKLENEVQDLRKRVADIQTALDNEKNKPPREVVKTVEKIVDRVVEKPVDEKQVVEGFFKRLWARFKK